MRSTDSSCVDELKPSPNWGERAAGAKADMIVLHYTGMPDAGAALDWLCDGDSGVSAHYLVFEDGRVVQMVAEDKRAWHAGQSAWHGATDINSCSIGIEIANPGHDHGYADFADQQIDAVIALCGDIVARHAIASERLLAHSDVAPTRKWDPGEKFPWQRLHEAGLGHWVPPVPLVEGDGLRIGAEGPAVSGLQSQLAGYGYGVERTGRYDELTEACVTAFQRHFRPARVDGVADGSTIATLEALLAALE